MTSVWSLFVALCLTLSLGGGDGVATPPVPSVFDTLPMARAALAVDAVETQPRAVRSEQVFSPAWAKPLALPLVAVGVRGLLVEQGLGAASVVTRVAHRVGLWAKTARGPPARRT